MRLQDGSTLSQEKIGCADGAFSFFSVLPVL